MSHFEAEARADPNARRRIVVWVVLVAIAGYLVWVTFDIATQSWWEVVLACAGAAIVVWLTYRELVGDATWDGRAVEFRGVVTAVAFACLGLAVALSGGGQGVTVLDGLAMGTAGLLMALGKWKDLSQLAQAAPSARRDPAVVRLTPVAHACR